MSSGSSAIERDPTTRLPLPTTDPLLRADAIGLAALSERWADQAALRSMSAEQMRGADARAQRLGVAGDRLMEEAGCATAAAARALLQETDRSTDAHALVLCGPGNNGGDGFVAARYLAGHGIRSTVVLVASRSDAAATDAARNWRRLDGSKLVERIHAPRAHDVALLLNGIQRASIVVDALLGTGVRGRLREPISTAVEVCDRARAAAVPILAVDTPTALDLTSGEPSDPVVRAHVTVTFHRPKMGLVTRTGMALAGRVLVAPIGIPLEADRL